MSCVGRSNIPTWVTLFHDSFRFDLPTWSQFALGCPNWAIDTHIYQAWDPAGKYVSINLYVYQYTCSDRLDMFNTIYLYLIFTGSDFIFPFRILRITECISSECL